MSDFTIGHVTDPKEGPVDGVFADTKGTYTKFKGFGAPQKEKRVLRQEVTDVGIKASLQTGMVRITLAAEWQLKQAKQSGALMNDVIREVGVLTGKSDTEILRLFQDAGLTGMLQDAKPLLQAGKLKTSDIVLSGAMQRTMEAAAEK